MNTLKAGLHSKEARDIEWCPILSPNPNRRMAGKQMTQETTTLQRIDIFTDGGCEPNPGAGGYGVILVHPKKRAEASGGFRLTTNNRLEIFAVSAGLELLKMPCEVTVYSDSKYVVDAMAEGWAANWKLKGWWRTKTEKAANSDLWDRLLQLCEVHKVRFKWVKGHAGHRENERCDQLAMVSLKKPELPIDVGYENRADESETRPPLADPGEPCRKCAVPVVRKESAKKPKRTRDYYYEYFLFCPGCGTTYQTEKARRKIEDSLKLL